MSNIFNSEEFYSSMIERELDNDSIYTIVNKTKPYYNDMTNFMTHIYRRQFCDHISWAIPSRDAISSIADFVGQDKVLEIGAGLGLWARLLENKGIDIKATTTYNSNHTYSLTPKTWTEVEVLEATKAIEKYQERTCLFICWGSFTSNNPLEYFKGNKLIVVGEESGGCTYAIDNGELGFKLVDKVEIPVWVGLHDNISFYIRE